MKLYDVEFDTYFLPFTQTSLLFNFTELFVHVFKYELFEKIYHYYFTFLSPEFCLANFHWKISLWDWEFLG